MSAATYPTKDEIKAQLLSDFRYLYARAGITVNVNRWSELERRAEAYSGRVSVAIANGEITADNVNPMRATGDALVALAGVYGVEKRPASSATGFVRARVLSPATTLSIPASFQCTDASGVKYQTTSTDTYADLDPVRVQAVVSGANTDLAADSIVTWDSAAIGYLGQTATVAAGGIDGGADEDTEEILRSRFLRRLRFPSVGGNWAQVLEWAEASSASIVFAPVYPAARGPASYDVAIMGAVTDPSLNSSTIDAAAAAIVTEMPGCANLNLTTISEEQLDAVVNLGLPLPVFAGGAGGGWKDSTPWPSTDETGVDVYAEVTATVPGSGTITVNSTSADPPLPGNRFALWDYTNTDSDGNIDPKFREFTILSVAGPSGTYVLTIDSPYSDTMEFIETGMFCSAAADNLQTYGDLFVEAMGLLGPGEKTDNDDILQWSRRQPSPDVERPMALTSRQLSHISDARTEISDISFAVRLVTGTGAAGLGTFVALTTPSVPATIAGSPRLLTLKHLAFRRQA